MTGTRKKSGTYISVADFFWGASVKVPFTLIELIRRAIVRFANRAWLINLLYSSTKLFKYGGRIIAGITIYCQNGGLYGTPNTSC